MISNLPLINVYQRKSSKSKIVTQLLYGDTFKKLEKHGSWIKIKNDTDSYSGYIKNKNFPVNQKSTHKVCNLYTLLYSKPNIKNKTKKILSFGSKVKILGKKNNFYKVNNFWIKKNDLIEIKYKTKNVFKNITKFLNVRYKWGGKHCKGVDCSGLVQLCLNFNNKFCPRDSIDQIKYFKKKIKIENLRKNDLIFWKGHVAVVISKNNLIHAYGPSKKTIIMPIKQTIYKIYKTANLKVIGIRRII